MLLSDPPGAAQSGVRGAAGLHVYRGPDATSR